VAVDVKVLTLVQSNCELRIICERLYGCLNRADNGILETVLVGSGLMMMCEVHTVEHPVSVPQFKVFSYLIFNDSKSV
jgi:hypothetical protein